MRMLGLHTRGWVDLMIVQGNVCSCLNSGTMEGSFKSQMPTIKGASSQVSDPFYRWVNRCIWMPWHPDLLYWISDLLITEPNGQMLSSCISAFRIPLWPVFHSRLLATTPVCVCVCVCVCARAHTRTCVLCFVIFFCFKILGSFHRYHDNTGLFTKTAPIFSEQWAEA